MRIHAVSELTGVPEPTLRAWERRYGIPTPVRTASGYRLFGPREIAEVREMRRLCDEGVAAAEAANVVRARRGLVAAAEEPQADASTNDSYSTAVEALVDSVVRFDDEALEEVLRRIAFLGAPVPVLDRVLRPSLMRVGQLWHDGEISIAQEHLASHRIGTYMRESLRLLPGASSRSRVVLGCFADDEHELGLLGVAMRFSEWGLRPVLLGARTPPSAVRAAVSATSPVLVALSLTIPPERARARELCDEYQSACGGVPWLVGGGAARSIGTLITSRGGVLVPDDPEALRKIVEDLVQKPQDKAGRAAPKGKKT